MALRALGLALIVLACCAMSAQAGELAIGSREHKPTPFRFTFGCYGYGQHLTCYLERACYKLAVGKRTTVSARHWSCRRITTAEKVAW